MSYKKIAMDHDKKIALEEYRTRNLEMKVGNGQDVGGYNREIREAQ